MLYRLVILNGPQAGLRWTVPEGPMVIGSGPDCALCLCDPEVASRHAVVEMDGDRLRIRDLGTMNRLLVNHREVPEAMLKHGDVVEIGRTRLMVEAHVQAEVEVVPDEGLVPGVPRRGRAYAAAAVAVGVAGLLVWTVWAPWRRGSELARVTAEAPTAEPLGTAPADEAAPASRDSGGAVGVGVTDGPATTDSGEARSAASADAAAGGAPAGALPMESSDAPAPGGAMVRTDAESSVPGLAEVPPASPAVPEPSPLPEPPVVERLIAQARAALEENRWAEAEQLVNGALALDANHVGALELKAHLWEQRGMVKRAIDLWSHLEHLGDADLKARAARERRRLIALDGELAESPPAVRLADVTHARFPADGAQGEIRLLQIRLERDGSLPLPDTDAVRVEVIFYELDPATGEIRPMNGEGPLLLRPEGPWPEEEDLTLVATCQGAVREEAQGRSPVPVFYGYRVRLVIYDRLAAEWVRPRSLSTDQAAARTSTHGVDVP